tara:strand:+ start:662 stop:844 length:183 start_codon:yes stop_codon:yes gene_type:complete
MLLIRLLGVAVFATRLPIDSTAARRPVIILMEEKKKKKENRRSIHTFGVWMYICTPPKRK